MEQCESSRELFTLPDWRSKLRQYEELGDPFNKLKAGSLY
jgi:hypothetical protein